MGAAGRNTYGASSREREEGADARDITQVRATENCYQVNTERHREEKAAKAVIREREEVGRGQWTIQRPSNGRRRICFGEGRGG